MPQVQGTCIGRLGYLVHLRQGAPQLVLQHLQDGLTLRIIILKAEKVFSVLVINEIL